MTEATVVTPRDRFHTVAGNTAQDARVPVELRTEVDDPYDAYRRARRDRDGQWVFVGLPDGTRVGRYHSLAVERSVIPDYFIETASTDGESDVVMAVRHAETPHIGVQLHPESVLTEGRKATVQNVLARCRRWEQ